MVGNEYNSYELRKMKQDCIWRQIANEPAML